jgi:hypothetical protein
MPVTKQSLSLDEHVSARVRRAASEDGMSFSAWISRAAERELVIHEGLRGVAEWEADAGALTVAERAAAAEVLDRILSGPERAPSE